MKTIEFTSRLENGAIAVPSEYGLLEGREIRVSIQVDEQAEDEQPCVPQDDATFWKQVSGSWQGDLVRAPQGEYPQRLDLG